MTHKDAITELRRELKMRRNVWQNVPGSPEMFVSRDHQTQYDTLKALLEVVEAMKPAEFHIYQTRAARLKDEAAAQATLFT